MKFFSFILTASLLSVSNASANFKSKCNTVSSQMTNLNTAIGQIKQVAQQLGHTAISAKCDTALRHLGNAQGSWVGISAGFSNYPWKARSSPHAGIVKLGLSSCGIALNWIYQQPELINPLYQPCISSCQNNWNWCNSGCQSIWNWPSPPGYLPPPQPSHGYSGWGWRHKRAPSSCPISESACPVLEESQGFECIDTKTELTSCGGCVTLGQGENCLNIEGAEGVGCLDGSCVILSLKPGYTKNELGRPILIES